MSKGTLEIHSENILPIIKKWLYSDKDIFVRELVSNSCDAILKVKHLQEQGALPKNGEEENRIDVTVDKEKKTLVFSDTGIGMDEEEVKKYIAQIAFSSAEEFMEKYKSNKEGDQIIGHFGLGFYSAYMVAEKVEVNTLSYKEGAKPALWTCDGSREYELKEGTRTQRGTTITLFVSSENEDYLERATIEKILKHYCTFLPYPIYLGEERINPKEPLWIKAPSECTKEDYLDFYKHLYPFEEAPLFWVHLNVDYPFHLKGILYFPKINRQFDYQKSSVQLYCNRVFVSDNCKDIIPEYLMMLRGAIDSPDIPLNVSRSYLQMDKTVRQLSSHISKKVSDSLATLYRNEHERYVSVWEDISPIIKLGALEDEKFYDRVKDVIIWKNVEGEWTTIHDYLERNTDKNSNKVLYTTESKHFGHIVHLYREKGIEILIAAGPVDNYLIQFLERKLAPTEFKRIDAEISDHLLDKDREKTALDESGRSEAAKIAELISQCLGNENIEVVAKSLNANALPGFIVIDEQQRRMRDYMLQMAKGDANLDSMGDLIGKKTFVINTNNPLVNTLEKLHSQNPELAKDLVQEMYDLALLEQKELSPHDLAGFIQRSNRVLEKLAEKATQH
ncbi:MAG: molecular chaperone HtpG [Parachlamydiales bacterium]